jgi:hypothetical protein
MAQFLHFPTGPFPKKSFNAVQSLSCRRLRLFASVYFPSSGPSLEWSVNIP